MSIGESIGVISQLYLLAFVVALGVSITIKLLMKFINAIGPKEEKKITE